MAEVFAGSTIGAEGFSRRVAIKRVLPGYSDHTGFAGMFVAEARISSQLVHPNIVSVLDFDRDANGQLFLVMELVDGKDLDALLGSGVLPLPVVIFIIGEVLRGLGFAHDLPSSAGGGGMRGIVHRDVSPHNVLLSWEGEVKVSDFGIAKARAASEATASLFIKGKPAYMSPEQANGQRLDGRSDLFAVGVILWEMLVGKRLFVAEDTRATLAAVLFGQIPRPRTLRADVPKDLERVTMKLLERDLPARYATAEEAIADLTSCNDAPRSGREVLISVLAERFPDAAPVRQSLARARLGAPPTAPPVAVPVRGHPTLTATVPGTAAAGGSPPGLGTMRAASTATLARRPRAPQVLAVLAVLIASAIVSFLIVSAARRSPAGGRGAGSAAGSTLPPQPRAIEAPDDSATMGSGAAPARQSDAGSSAPKPRAFAAQPKHPVAVQKSGILRVEAMPALSVTVDDTAYGDTPLTIPLPAGNHRVRLQNGRNDFNELLEDVIIRENQTTTIERKHP